MIKKRQDFGDQRLWVGNLANVTWVFLLWVLYVPVQAPAGGDTNLYLAGCPEEGTVFTVEGQT